MHTFRRVAFGIVTVVTVWSLFNWVVSCSQDPCGPAERQIVEVATPIYKNDFSASLGDEWSVDVRETSPTGVQFLGRFGGDQLAQLSLSGLPSHTSLTLTLKVYIIHSWDGNLQNDRWKCSVLNGPTLLMANFSNSTETQSYPLDASICGGGGCHNCPAQAGASAVDSLDFLGSTASFGDAIYDVAVTFPHSEDSIVIEFRSYLSGLNLDDESWGIDDVYLWKGPPTFPNG